MRIGRKRYYIDFAYPEVMLAIEVDGYEQRASTESLAYDNNRANQLVLAGWTILRFGWERVVNDPQGLRRRSSSSSDSSATRFVRRCLCRFTHRIRG